MPLPVPDRLRWLAVAGASAFLGGKLVMLSFRKGMQAFDLEPPDHPAHPDTPLEQAVLWAVGGAAIAAATKLFVRRGVAHLWRQTRGAIPT